MNTAEREDRILERIRESGVPVSGGTLAREPGVSRQSIVKDISALKERGYEIIATTKGYMLRVQPRPERVFKVVHADDEVRRELETIVRTGGEVRDVFVWHKIYGRIEGALNIKTQQDINEYIESLENGRSSPLKKVTNEYHYHTVTAESEEVLDRIGEALDEIGFLVKDED